MHFKFVLKRSLLIIFKMDLFNTIALQSSQSPDLQKLATFFTLVPPDWNDNICIRWACTNGHTDVINFLLQFYSVDPSCLSNYCIRIACENGHTDIVRSLLKDNRVNPATHNNFPIQIASRNGHYDIVRLLIRHQSVNPCGVQLFPKKENNSPEIRFFPVKEQIQRRHVKSKL